MRTRLSLFSLSLMLLSVVLSHALSKESAADVASAMNEYKTVGMKAKHDVLAGVNDQKGFSMARLEIRGTP